ncbi:MAG: hypothetical protein CSYNP_02296 [Syntrophus sp. SKADARSKE-3]|nr:hypothetical protein [Syntrophus sp. SKADARSKE-3]
MSDNKFMKKFILVVAILAIMAASQAFADTLNLTTLPVVQANGYYVGAIGGNINGGTTANYYCDDFATASYVPSSFTVLVSTLSNISGTKFISQTNALQKYQQVGWLMYEMSINPTKVADIQFAMWSVFTPNVPTYGDSAAWLDASTKINASSYDFSKMRIYTPTSTTNQEFVGGSVTAAPEPAEWALIIIGLGLMTYSLYRNRARGTIMIRV